MTRPRRAIPFAQVPEQLPSVTRFSDEPRFSSPHELVAMIKGQPRLLARLIAATTIHHDSGPERKQGLWALLFLAYMLEGKPAIKKWWSGRSGDKGYWSLFGFDGWIPDWRTVYLRFDELKKLGSDGAGDKPGTLAFEELAISLIREARRRDPRVGAWVHIDGTEVEAHVRLHHDCRPGEGCRADAPHHLSRATTETASRHRQQAADVAVDTPIDAVEADGLTGLQIERRVPDARRGGVRLRIGGHWFWARDPDVGVRTYRTAGKVIKSWIGFVGLIGTDHFTGGTLLPQIYRADQNESTVFPQVVQRLQDMLDESPTWISVDKGPATKANYEVCTRAGIGLVAPYRRENGSAPLTMPRGPKGPNGHLWDHEGRVLCPHCGSETVHRGFSNVGGKPRIAYECVTKTTAQCQTVKKISCSQDWRALIPHPRNSDAYTAMAIGHSPSERTHGALRERFGILGKSLAGRTKKTGLDWQRLRTAAAWLIEWLWISRRMGWLHGEYERVVGKPTRPTAKRLKDSKASHRRRQEALRGGRNPTRGKAPPEPAG